MRLAILALSLLLSDSQPPDATVQVAITTASNQLGVSPDELTVTESAQEDWPDSALGCPQPGMAYSQIVTPGWQITIETNDGSAEIDVHTDNGSRAVIC